MKLNYDKKELKMKFMLEGFESAPGFRSLFKGVPMGYYEEVKPFIDFTKYFVLFRGPRPSIGQVSTRKRDAKAFDVYERDARVVSEIRLEREAFYRGVEYGRKVNHYPEKMAF